MTESSLMQELLPLGPQGARHSTSLSATTYLGQSGRLMGNPQSRGWVHQTVGQWLRVARTAEERARVMNVWRKIHYLAKPDRGPHYDPIGRKQIRIHYYLDLPALRLPPFVEYPGACVTIKHSSALNGMPTWLGLKSPMQALEIARNFLADDLRYPAVPDLAPEILREVVRRTRAGVDWATEIRGRVEWTPQWLLTFSDPAVGHDGGLYRGAGAKYLGTRKQGTEMWGWPLTAEAMALVT